MNNFKKLLCALGSACVLSLAASSAYAATAATATSCTVPGVMAALTAFETAVTTKNTAAVDAMISATYLHRGENKAAFMAQVNNAFAGFQSVSMSYSNVTCTLLSNGNADVRGIETFTGTNTGVAPNVQPNGAHLILKPTTTNAAGWLNHGNQLNFDLQHNTGMDSAFSWLNIWINDMHGVVQSAVVSAGPGINAGGMLFSTSCNWNGAPSTCWGTYDAVNNVSSLNPNPITLPLTYTLTVTGKSGAVLATGNSGVSVTATSNVVVTKSLTFDTWQPNFASNLAPSGNVTASPTFTWVAPSTPSLIGGPYTYSVGLDLVTATSQTQIWNDYNVNTATSSVYTGAALSNGACYRLNVYTADMAGNESTAYSYFGYNLPAGAVCGATGVITASGTGTNYDQMFIGRNQNPPAAGENFGVGLRYPRSTGDNLSSYSITCPGAATVNGVFAASAGFDWVNVNMGNVQPVTPFNCSSTVTYTNNTSSTAIATVDRFAAPTAYPSAVSLAANSNQVSVPQVTWTAGTLAVGTLGYQVSVDQAGFAAPRPWFVGQLTGSPAPAYNGTALTPNTSYVYGVASVEGYGTNKMYAAQVFTPFCYQCTTTSYTASGNYSAVPASATLTFTWTTSNFACYGPTVNVPATKTGLNVTATSMSWTGGNVWSRPSGIAGDPTGTWSATDPFTGTTLSLIINANGTMSMTGNVLGSCPGVADTQAPTIPTGLTATSSSPTQVNLSWTASTDNVGVTGYKLYRGGVMLASTAGNVTSFTDTGLAASTSYSYTVSACDAAGNCSAQSGAAGVVTSPATATDTQAPTIPGNVLATASSSTQVNLSWTASTDNVGVTSYQIYRGGVLMAAMGGTTTSWADAGLSPATAYSYTVAACDFAGNCSAQSTASTVTTNAAGAAAGTVLNLVASWNLLGNSANAPLDVATTFGNTANVTTVWKWVPATSKWAFYAPSMTPAALATYATGKGYDVLTTINAGEGFWVNAKVAFSATLPAAAAVASSSFADQLAPPNKLPAGWSLIAVGDSPTPRGFVNAISTTPPATPAVAAVSLTTLWAWDSTQSNWYFYAPSLDNSGGLANYITGKSYLPFGTKVLDPSMGFWVNHP